MAGLQELTKNSIYNIYIYSYSIDTLTRFPAFLTDYSDNFKASWTTTTVLGKMDPIATYKNTARSITIAFDVPNESIQEAAANMRKVDAIIKGMYPVYKSDGSEQTNEFKSYIMNSPPMFRVKFANLITNASKQDKLDVETNIYKSFVSEGTIIDRAFGLSNKLNSGLLGYINDFSFKPDSSSGYFIDNSKLLPKLIKINFTLNVIHEHALGNSVSKNDKLIPRLQKDDNTNIMSFPHNYDERTINITNEDSSYNTGSFTSSDEAEKKRLENNILL